MKLLALIISNVFFLTACTMIHHSQRKGNAYAPEPTKEMAIKANTSFEIIQEGYGIYMRKCGECHVHLLPDEVTKEEWHIIVPGMAWNSGIEPKEERALLKYLIGAKKTSP